jgi:hypothetical protein
MPRVEPGLPKAGSPVHSKFRIRIEIVHRRARIGSRALPSACAQGTTNPLKGTEGTVLFRRADFADNKARLPERLRMG